MNWARSRKVGPARVAAFGLGAAFAGAGIGGCGASHPLLPLKLRESWTYVVRFGLNDQRVETLSVTRQTAVANTTGYELAGAMGASRLAWNGSTLYADETANAFFNPSMPLLAEDGRPRSWEGRVTVDGRSYSATAHLEQTKKPVRLTIAGHTYSAVEATLTVQLARRGNIELKSWYESGTGLVQQEQRTNDNRVFQIQLVTAP